MRHQVVIGGDEPIDDLPGVISVLHIACLTAQNNVKTQGGKADRVAKFATSTTIVDSAITEIGGKVGIGVTGTPSSTLTVNGEVQSLSGGIKFPDNTVQSTAAIKKVHTNGTLTGAGTAQSPLEVTLPFSAATTTTHGAAFSLINSNSGANTFAIGGRGWGGLLGVGTDYGVEGLGLASVLGDTGGGAGGRFVGGDCGTQCTHVSAGDGVSSIGGNTALGVGGAGISAQGGSATGTFNVGGNGINATGGNASGAGGQGGIGIFAAPGSGSVGNYAGYFYGDVRVTGNLSKAGGSFQIDHPLHPEDKYLYHSFVESPDMMNIYDGNVTTDSSGVAVVTLPDWFEALNRDFRYQLTVIGQFAQAVVASEGQPEPVRHPD